MVDTEQNFFHVTQKDYVEDILSDGLYPGEDVEKLNVYHNRSGHRTHIYFWNEENARRNTELILDSDEEHVWTREEHTLIELDPHDKHPIERDYDQLLYVLRYLDEDKDWRTEWVEPFLERFNIKFEGPLKEDNLREHMDHIPEAEWSEKVGSYRTTEPFPPKNISHVGFDYFD